jgi:RNA ligase (TIGR02306 family)
MSEWNPQIVKIEKVALHAGADTLAIYTVLNDYPVIDKIGKYQVGDLAGYLPVETIVPDTEQFYFLCPQNYEKYVGEDGAGKQRPTGPKFPLGLVPERSRRLKAKKLRGVYSMGLLVMAPDGMNEGDSLIEVLGLIKFEEEEEENIPGVHKMRGSNAEAPPKGWVIPHYDIEGLRKYLPCLIEGEEVVLTEKLHGSSSSFTHDGERLWVKSRNWFKKRDEVVDPWWNIAIRYELESKLSKFPMMAFFGELHSQVKGFPYDSEIIEGKRQTKMRFFDVYDVKKMSWLDYDDCVAMVKEAGLDMVPVLYRGPWLGKDKMYPYAEGLTTLGGRHIREGFVVKTVKERYEPKLNSRLTLKLVGEGYSLQK